MIDDSAARAEVRTGLIAAVSTYFIWGLMPLFLRMLNFADVREVLAQRILWTAPCCVAAIAVLSGTRGLTEAVKAARRPAIVFGLALSALMILINWGTYIWAVQVHRMIEGSLGYFLNPLVSVALGVLFFGEKLRPLQITAIVIAGAGVTAQGVALGGLPWLSLVLCFTFAFYGMIRKRVNVPAPAGLLIETALLAPLAAGTLLWLGAFEGLAFGGEPTHTALLILGGPVTSFPLILFAVGARRLKLSTIGLLQYIAPSIQFMVALALGETISALGLTCFALIWAALALFSFDALRHDSAQRQAYSAAINRRARVSPISEVD